MKAFTVALCVLMPCAARSQKAAPHAICTFDTAARRDTVAHVLSVVALRGRDTMPDDRLSHAVGTMIREHFHAPTSIGALFYPAVVGPMDGLRRLASSIESSAYGSFGFSVRRDGTLGNIHLLATTGDSATDTEIVRALFAASDSGEGMYLSGPLRDTDDDVRILIISQDASSAEPLVRVRVPTIHAEVWPTIRSTKTPKYPQGETRTGMPAVVELNFVIDETGRAMPTSIRVVSSPDREFAESAVAAVTEERFRPARAGGCPVKTRVGQRVRYASNH